MQERHSQPTGTIPFDLADHLRTPEGAALHVETAIRGGALEFVAAAISDVARARGISLVVGETNLSQEGLYEVLTDPGQSQLSTLKAALKAVGLRLSVEPLPTEPARSTGWA